MKELSIQTCYNIVYNGMYMLLKNRILLAVVIGTVLVLSVFHYTWLAKNTKKEKG